MIAGISGHQDLGSEEQIDWIRVMVARELASNQVTVGYSCLAKGADQLFAELILINNLKLIAVIPSVDYEQTFDDYAVLQMYRAQRDKAYSEIKLQHQAPTEQAFYEASVLVVDCSEILIAVWNNMPAKGFGGTADVVAYAKSVKKTIIHINPADRTIWYY